MELTIQEIQKIETEILKEIHEICEKHNIKYYLAYGSVLGAIRHQGPIPWDSDSDIIVPINQYNKFVKVIEKELSEMYYLEYFETNKYSTPLFARIGLRGYSTRILHIDVFKLIGLPNDIKKQKTIQKATLILQRLHYVKRVQKWDLINASHKRKIIICFLKFLLFPLSSKFIQIEHNKLCNKHSIDDSKMVINASGGYGDKEIIKKSILGKGEVLKYSNIDVVVPIQYDAYLKHFYNDYMRIPPESERKIKENYNIIKIINKYN